jgi:carboxymethylenebutenolidase
MRHILITIAVLLLAGFPAWAQDFAKQRLEKSTRHQEWVKVEHDGRTVHAFVVYPEAKEKASAVLVIHEIFGLTDWVRSLTDQLAEAGYIAIAPDLLSGMGPNGGNTDAFSGQKQVMQAIRDLPADQITADLNAVSGYVTKLPAASGKLSVCGFCWGGGQSFRYATNNKNLRAAYVFYGPPPTKAEDIARINCPVYGFYGENDARINATIDRTKELIKEASKTYEPVIYDGAGHGFMRQGDDPKGREADRKGRDEAWKRWKELLKNA